MINRFLKNAVLQIIRLGAPEPYLYLNRVPEYVQIRRLLETLRINCIIDVGANKGQSGLLFRGLGYQGPIFSFEPQNGPFEALEGASRNDPQWLCFKVALGDAPQTLNLHIDPGSREMASLQEFTRAPAGISTEEVVVIPLDSIYPALVESIPQPRVFLKTDAEGYDLNVIRGAVNSLPDVLALQAEVFIQPVYRQVPSFLAALGEYGGVGFELVNLMPVSWDASGAVQCMNVLLKRAS